MSIAHVSWVMSSHESCHTYEWFMSHGGLSHATQRNESCHIWEWVMLRIGMSPAAQWNLWSVMPHKGVVHIISLIQYRKVTSPLDWCWNQPFLQQHTPDTTCTMSTTTNKPTTTTNLFSLLFYHRRQRYSTLALFYYLPVDVNVELILSTITWAVPTNGSVFHVWWEWL